MATLVPPAESHDAEVSDPRDGRESGDPALPSKDQSTAPEKLTAERRLPYPVDAHPYNHDPGVNACRNCGGSKHWPVHQVGRQEARP
jgi:hypothetical protein